MIKIAKGIIHPYPKHPLPTRRRAKLRNVPDSAVKATKAIIRVRKGIARLIAESPRLGSMEI